MVSWSEALPYVSQAATLAVAAAAVAFTHKSSRDTGARELSTRMWEKRTDTYTEILRALRDLDPTRRPSPEGFVEREHADGQPSDGIELLARDLDSEEWQEFTARVDSFASEETRYLFSLWLASLAGWSWLTMKCLIHHGADGEKYAESTAELDQCYAGTWEVSKELTAQVRAELAFKKRSVRRVVVTAPEGFLGAVTDVKFVKGRQKNLEPLSAARLVSVKHGSPSE